MIKDTIKIYNADEISADFIADILSIVGSDAMLQEVLFKNRIASIDCYDNDLPFYGYVKIRLNRKSLSLFFNGEMKGKSKCLLN